MTIRRAISLIALWSLSWMWTPLGAQDDGIVLDEYLWLRTLVDSIEQDSDLCTTCPTPPEIRSYFAPNGSLQFRLYYVCGSLDGVTKFYGDDGSVLALCQSGTSNQACSQAVTTTYTFGTNITEVWSCDVGYNCDDVARFDLFEPYEVSIDGDGCGDEVVYLSTTEPFVNYEWTLPDGTVKSDARLAVELSGDHCLVVTNDDGCKDTTTTLVNINNALALNVLGPKVICDQPITLSVPGFVRYDWSTGDTTESIIVDRGLDITIRAFDSLGCVKETTINIEDQSNGSIDIVNAYADVYEGQQLDFVLDIEGIVADEIVNIAWSINDMVVSTGSESVSFEIAGEQTVLTSMLETQSGCIFTAELRLQPLPVNREFYIPTIFYPKSQIGNDKFYIQGLAGTIAFSKLTVYDRWGMPVFEHSGPKLNDVDSAWDGTRNGVELPSGNYVYSVKVEYANGEMEQYRGTVLLLN